MRVSQILVVRGEGRARAAGGSCCQPHILGSELSVERTGGLLSCLSKVPEGCCVHLRKYHRGFELSVAAVERTGGLLSCLSKVPSVF